MSGLQPKGRKTLEARADVSGPCPFCHKKGGNITLDFGDEAQPARVDSVSGGTIPAKPARNGMLFHSLPYCDTYSRLSADEFVRAVIERKHLS